ncbi:MAG: biphenyl 2,3-dioxygenase [Deltaproteobacteria bacterium]|jgi:catechol-2,3-dioxygenase|nr:biphenyl 2,3-dioxygenase [Deltaproteobacteria bacterium]
MVSPIKLAHVAIQTDDIGRMRDWYAAVLQSEVVFENDLACFTTYDDEHHRVVFIKTPGFTPGERAGQQLHHLSFTYAGFDDLIDTYERLRDQGIAPALSIHHGPTFSFYYRDPDGNNVELQIDTMSMDEARDFVRSEVFEANPIGIPFDPEDVLARYRAGASAEELTQYG